VETPDQAIESLDWLRKEKLVISNFHLTRPNLDEVFLALTGKTVVGPDAGGGNGGKPAMEAVSGGEIARGEDAAEKTAEGGAGGKIARGEDAAVKTAMEGGAGGKIARGKDAVEKTTMEGGAGGGTATGIDTDSEHRQGLGAGAGAERPDLRRAEIDRLFGSPVSARHSGIITQHLMFAWRALLKIKHIPEQYIDVLVTPVMFTFMFTYLFGGAVAGSTREYLQFLIPGILVQTLTFNTMYAGINIHTDISKGIFDRFRSMPVWLPAPLAGFFIGDLFRYLISGVVVMAFGALIGFRPETGIPGIALAFAISILFASAVSWMAVIIGLTFRNASAVMSVGWLILTPVVFMSNIYVDPVTMPEWLQTFIAFNPLSWQVDAVRSLLSGRFELALISTALAGSLVIGLLLAPVGIYFYRKER
jgi:ABC-2 type transport system permease protein